MSSKLNIEDSNPGLENIQTEECRENKVYRINTAASRDHAKGAQGGGLSTRSGDNKKVSDANPMKQHIIRVKNVTRGRNAGSVGAKQ